jgi:uncharacterized protein (DUF58 family)
VSPTTRAAALLGVAALGALAVPLELALLGAVAVVSATLVDAVLSRRAPELERSAPSILYRGVRSPLALEPADRSAGRGLRLRQPVPPDLRLEPSEADGRLEGELTPLRRGRHELPRPALRVTGPLGLGCTYRRALSDAEVLVYPDLPAAWRLVLSVRQGRFRQAGRQTRGPLGLGTDFESIRDYLPDDDVRQINWSATSRLGRPMSNQYRVEQDRDVICVLDTGRLMAAPLGDRTRLDAAVDAAVAVAAVADEVGDRCGMVAFDRELRRRVGPRRRGAAVVVRALFDLEPRPVESDYELAFHAVGDAKRALVLVFTDLLEEAAARPLVAALPVLRRRHVVAIASAADTDLHALVAREPARPRDVYTTAAALDVLAARARVAAELRRAGADVIEAPPDALGAACVRVYLRAKARARL